MSEIINGLTLSNNEERIYLLLLSMGQLSTTEIAQMIEGKVSEVVDILWKKCSVAKGIKGI